MLEIDKATLVFHFNSKDTEEYIYENGINLIIYQFIWSYLKVFDGICNFHPCNFEMVTVIWFDHCTFGIPFNIVFDPLLRGGIGSNIGKYSIVYKY